MLWRRRHDGIVDLGQQYGAGPAPDHFINPAEMTCS
jgi:hypothetical protein